VFLSMPGIESGAERRVLPDRSLEAILVAVEASTDADEISRLMGQARVIWNSAPSTPRVLELRRAITTAFARKDYPF